MKKKLLIILYIFLFLFYFSTPAKADTYVDLNLYSPSCLLMESSTRQNPL